MPYVIWMVFSTDAKYLPALILHAASATTIMLVISLSIIGLSIINYNAFKHKKLNKPLNYLIYLSPIFVWLAIYKVLVMGEYIPIAVSYIGYYLSFFAFFYGVLISKTVDNRVLYSIYFSLFVLSLSGNLFDTDYHRVQFAFSVVSASLLISLGLRKSIPGSLILPAIYGIFILFSDPKNLTFTVILIIFLVSLFTVLYYKNKKELLIKSLGLNSFLLIVGVIAIGVIKYGGVSFAYIPDSFESIKNLNEFIDRFSFKLFWDRAPYWAGGIEQILFLKPILPDPAIPKITAFLSTNQWQNVDFGSHSTIIELIRIYGIVAGGILVYLLISIVLRTRSFFVLPGHAPLLLAFSLMSIITTIVLTLAGTFQLLPEFSLISMGFLGILYSKYFQTNVNNK